MEIEHVDVEKKYIMPHDALINLLSEELGLYDHINSFTIEDIVHHKKCHTYTIDVRWKNDKLLQFKMINTFFGNLPVYAAKLPKFAIFVKFFGMFIQIKPNDESIKYLWMALLNWEDFKI